MISSQLWPPCRIGLGAPKVTYNTVSPDGKLSEGTRIDVQRAQLMHDFGITPNYAVFLDQNLIFSPQACPHPCLPHELRRQPNTDGLILDRPDNINSVNTYDEMLPSKLVVHFEGL